MGLEEYRRKRRFARTPEPAGKVGKRSQRGAGRFVVQKHGATRLHYDFRLESDGVLKSWAVPKGPSLDPGERRLAVEVEDHPLEYGSFEGIIPEGEYGGGTVLLWDRGRWQPEGDATEGWRKGHLKIHLEGEKLKGGWNLVRLKGDEEKPNWLLIKEKDEAARPLAEGDILDERPESVESGRTLDEIAANPDRVWSSSDPRSKPIKKAAGKSAKEPAKNKKSAPKAAHAVEPARKARKTLKTATLPEAVAPELATLVAEPPGGEEWLYEIKLDGYRVQAAVAGGQAKLVTRNGKDWTARFPAVARAAAALPVDSALLDGEVVALDEDGRTSFQALQNALRAKNPARVAYFVFDLLQLNGEDSRGLPLVERKGALREMLAASSEDVLRYNDHVEGQGEAFYRQACKLGVEGIVAKRRDAPYRSGRGGDWLKVKCLARQELVIGGFTAPQGSRSGLGALLVGVYKDRKLRFAGKVGTGFDAATLADLTRRLKPLARATPPFDDPPRGAEARGVTWVEPELVAEVAFTEWTDDGRLRHPSFQGLREDKPAREVEQEKPAPVTASTSRSGKARKARKEVPAAASRKTIRNPAPEKGEPVVAGVTLSHPERVLYAEQGVTKLDLALYYQAVERFILPHLAGRPLTLVRCPQGRQKGCFYQKHLGEGMPAAVRSVAIREGDGGEEPYPYVEDLAGLVSLVQIGVLELHGWGASAGDLERPDRLVFDLDPDPAVPWPRVVQAAQIVRKGLAEIGLACFVQTTGGKGLHVVAPLSRRRSWPEIKEFARAFAEGIVRGAPDLYVSKASKAARAGKIFIDWLRNARGATAILPYSTRARPGATVATPLAWAELPGVHPDELTVETVPARLAKLRKDPWGDFPTARQTIRAETFRALGL